MHQYTNISNSHPLLNNYCMTSIYTYSLIAHVGPSFAQPSFIYVYYITYTLNPITHTFNVIYTPSHTNNRDMVWSYRIIIFRSKETGNKKLSRETTINKLQSDRAGN